MRNNFNYEPTQPVEEPYHGFQQALNKFRQREKTLTQSYEMFYKAFHASQDAIFITKLSNGEFVDVNRVFLDTFEYDREEVIGRTSFKLNIWLEPEKRRQLVAALLEDRSVRNLETDVKTKSGRILNSEFSADLIELSDQLYIVGSVRDITTRRKWQKELVESRQRLLMHVQNTPLGVIEWDMDFRVTRWNSAAEKIFGYTAQEAVGRHPIDLILPPDAVAEVLDVWKNLKGNQSGFHSKNDNLTKHGNVIHCEWYNTPLFGENGKIIAVASLVHDITEQRKTQIELKKSEERFRSIFESSSDCILVWDRDYNYLYANQSAIDHVGTTRDKVIGKNMRDGLGHVPDFMKLWMKRVDTVFENKQIMRVEDAVPVGDRLTYSESVLSPLKDETGDVFAIGVVYRDITERKRSEEDIRKAKESLQTIIDSMPFGVAVVDKNKTILSANQSALQLMGYEQEEDVVGRECNSTFCPNRELCPIFDQKKSVDYSECYLVNRNSKEIPIIKSAVPVLLDDQEVLIEAFVDISRQKEVEKELQLREQLLDFAIEQMPMPVIIASAPDVTISRYNKGALDFLTKPIDDLSAIELDDHREFWPTFHPDGRPYDIDDLPLTRAIKRGETTKNAEIIIRKEDGDYWVAASAAPLYDDTGKVVAGIVVFPDITDRKRTETLLKESEARIRRSVEDAPFPMMIHADDGKVILINKILTELTGFTHKDIPTVEDWIQKAYPLSLNTIKAGISDIFQADEKAHLGEYEVTTKDGSKRIWDISSAPLGNLYDGRKGIISMAVDVTDRKINEKKLEVAKERAELANKAKSEFLANMSHEIRTPLNAVLGFSDLLSTQVGDEKQRRYLDSIKTSGNALLKLINDILDLSKIEAGMLEVQQTPVIINNLFNEIHRIFSLEAERKNLAFNFEIQGDFPPVLLLDEIRLRQVLLNLVGNAVKFTEKGSVKLIGKGNFNNDEKTTLDLTISVVDTGIGIPAKDQKMVFDTFRQQSSENTRQYGGTGLGLTISKKLVELMNGSIRVESSLGRGSCFEIFFPGIQIPSSNGRHYIESGIDLESLCFERKKALVVDDDRFNRKLLKEILTHANFKVVEAADGQQALDVAIAQQPDIIFMDIWMPHMDGIEALKQIRQVTPMKKIPVVAVSATANVEKRIQKAPFDGYLSKPIRLEALSSELSKHFVKKQPVRTAEIHNPSPPNLEIYHQGDADAVHAGDPELIRIFEQDILPELEKFKGAINRKKLEQFSGKMRKTAREIDSGELLGLHEKLMKANISFDIIQIKKTLTMIWDMYREMKKNE
jgi:PAS domain S-box-containing protein